MMGFPPEEAFGQKTTAMGCDLTDVKWYKVNPKDGSELVLVPGAGSGWGRGRGPGCI